MVINSYCFCSEAELYLFGGCVTSWKVANKDFLFVRPDAVFNGQKPIRLLFNITLLYCYPVHEIVSPSSPQIVIGFSVATPPFFRPVAILSSLIMCSEI